MQNLNTKNTDQKSGNGFQRRLYLYTISSLRFISMVKGDNITKTIINQLTRSLTSICANIIEAKAANSKKDFARYFDITLKSANETKYWLCLLRDLDKADKIRLDGILKETVEIANILGASLLTMRDKRGV